MYSLDPTPIANYYQCYTKYADDDDDNTIITLNLRENNCENLSGLGQGFIKQKVYTVDKYSSGQVVEPAMAPEIVMQGTRV